MTPDPDRQLIDTAIDRLEHYYVFECHGGPLRNCVEWVQIKAALTRLRDERDQWRTTDAHRQAVWERTEAKVAALEAERDQPIDEGASCIGATIEAAFADGSYRVVTPNGQRQRVWFNQQEREKRIAAEARVQALAAEQAAHAETRRKLEAFQADIETRRVAASRMVRTYEPSMDGHLGALKTYLAAWPEREKEPS